MPRITIRMKDGTTKQFDQKGRSGGSYTNKIEYVEGFVIVTDEWGSTTAIPTADIKEIETHSDRF